MGILKDLGYRIVDNLTTSIRRFTAFMFLLYTAGIVMGWLVMNHNPQLITLAILLPLFFALLAYFSTAFAVVSFIVLTLMLFVL